MDEETEAPLEDMESSQDDPDDETLDREKFQRRQHRWIRCQWRRRLRHNTRKGPTMDEETEAPLEDIESSHDDEPSDELVARSSGGGSGTV